MSKSKIKIWLSKYPNVLRHLQFLHNLLLHNERLMHIESYGEKNKLEKILVIRPASEDGVQGLMSLFIQAVRWMDYAKKYDCIPYVDFKNYMTQYYDGKENAWDYFFKQPSKLTIKDVYESKNVVLSGSTWNKSVDNELFRESIFNNQKIQTICFSLVRDNIRYSDQVIESIERENENLHVENCIGLYMRGTDYTKLKPTGEFVQPRIDDVIHKVDDFLCKYGNLDIFLVTEDDQNYQRLKRQYGNKLKIVSYDRFIKNYDGKTFLSKSNVLEKDTQKRGVDYLVKIALLAKCKYLISSITMGSISAFALNGGKYSDYYIFDLGIYK